MKTIIISAIAANGVIGDSKKGLPWHIPEEFKHFKETTLGFPIIMGRKTFLELGKPLKGRLNIVLTADKSLQYDDDLIRVFHDMESALSFCELEKVEKVFIIGGKTVYTLGLKYCNEMILSFLKQDAEGDVFFPEFNRDEWMVREETEFPLFTVKYFVKKND